MTKVEQIKKLDQEGKDIKEIAEELEVNESFVYRILKGFGESRRGEDLPKSTMIRVSYLFSQKSQQELADDLETSYSYLWRVTDELKKDDELMQETYDEWKDTVEERGFEDLYEEFKEECKERANA